ncbi:MAG: YbdD/YjiX family protein [Campylobacteraceae bacterium]
MFENIAKMGKYLGQAARLMVGVPDYDTYVQHMKLTHPEQTPMTYEEFYENRVEARYGGKDGGRCC